ncbi:MAG TPA: signal peptidase II, partial [Gemmatirosa sp.]
MRRPALAPWRARAWRAATWPLAAALVLTDCASKRAVEAALPVAGASRRVIGEVVRFTLAYNQGAAFSSHFGPYQRWILIALTLAVLAGLGRAYPRLAATGRAARVGAALVAAGAVGNLLDRLVSDRGVVDFIDVGVGATRF